MNFSAIQPTLAAAKAGPPDTIAESFAEECHPSWLARSFPPNMTFAFFGLAVMTLSYAQFRDDDMFLQEHFCGFCSP